MRIKKRIIVMFVLSVLMIGAVNASDSLNADSAEDIATDNKAIDINTSISKETQDTQLSLAPDENTLSGEDETFHELKDRIENSPEGAVINLTNNYYLDNDTDPIVITSDDITIDGGEYGCVFDGGRSGISSVFTVYGKNVTLNNVMFINFRFDESNKLLEWFGDNGTMYNCHFLNNSAVNDGVVVWSGSNGVIESCIFDNNFALNGGALYIYSRDTTVRSSEFTNNRATDKGGAILVSGKGFALEKCSFENSTSEREGGAVHIKTNNGLISDCSFINSLSLLYGGAIYIIGDDNAVNNIYSYNNSAIFGGAIYLSGTGCIVNSSCFSTNFAYTYGGALFATNTMTLNIDNCKYANNSAYNSGAAIYLEEGGVISNSKFNKNIASNDGGAIYSEEMITIENSSFADNIAVGYGGALILDEGGEIFNSNFTDNAAFTSGGAIVTYDDLTLNNTHFKGNGAIDGTNNILLMGDSSVIADDKTTCDGPLSLRMVEMELISVEDINYGDTLNVVVYVTFMAEPVENGTVVNVVDGKSYTSNLTEGYANFSIEKLGAGNYTGVLSYNFEGFAKSPVSYSFSVYKQNASITAKTASFTINYAKTYSITLKDSKGNPLSGKKIGFVLNGKIIGSEITDAKGVAAIKITVKMLKDAGAGTKKLTVLLEDTNYNCPVNTVNVKINKEKTKLVAKKKTFKVSKKIKKFTVTLKNSKGKAVKKVKVTLKVKGKTFTAKTNSKGKATFKIKNLTKKGKYTAVVKFNANKYYKGVTKKVKITVKR